MSPRSGGEADKFGARYEGAWTVWRLLDVLRGDGTSLTVEVAGEVDDGAEFVYTRVSDGVVEAHQVKRQKGTANAWTAKSLNDLGIWGAAHQHIARGREFHFASTTPAPKLNELADRARRSESLEDFVKKWLTKGLQPEFSELAKADVYGSPQEAWKLLRDIYFHCADEDTVSNHNAGMSGALLEGAVGRLAAVGLGDLIVQNLGVVLTATEIEGRLAPYGLQRSDAARNQDLSQAVSDLTAHWRDSAERELLSPAIQRTEAGAIVSFATGPDSPITFVVGTAGGGKTATLALTVDQLVAVDVPVLAFRLDRLGNFDSTVELGERLGLDRSPAPALALAAAGEQCVLIIDQLDAVSLASGRLPTSFNAVEDLVREAKAFPNMRVVLACRQFDVDNDYRIRTLRSQLQANTVTVSPLSDAEVDAAVDAMGLDHQTLGPNQRELLRVPLHLVLLAGVADQPDAMNFQTSTHLFDVYWRQKRQMIELRKADVRFIEVIATITNAISDRQQLSVSDSVLDAGNLSADGDVFISEHVLVRDGNRLSFFHEAFFDYAFARQWSNESQSLVDFLTSNEQELFRRAQVRQILHHLRERDTSRYLIELTGVLASDAVRFHIKEAVMATLGGLTDPSSAELKIVLDAAASDCTLARHLWQMMRTDGWFARLDADGKLQQLLSSDDSDERARALEVLASAARSNPDPAAVILDQYTGHADYNDWLFWVVRFADVHDSRPLFDQLLSAVRSGAVAGREQGLWMAVYSLADHQPLWAIELLVAYFSEWSGGLDLDSSGKVARLDQNEHGLSELITKAASAEPAAFVAALLPYMVEVMTACASDSGGPGLPTDPHFSYHYREMSQTNDADDALHVAMRAAVEQVVAADPDAARATLEGLAAVRLSSAQSLLYLGLIAGAEQYATWSARLLLEGVDRLFCGTMDNSVWVTRQLIEAIAPFLEQETHEAIEDAVRDLRFEWEGRHGGRYAFDLLSALQRERLSELGKRRLGEYQRKFNAETPPAPAGITSGSIYSPIPSAATAHMTDENWRQAMAKHDADRSDWSTFRGGARELAHVLQQQTKEDPLRFLRLALQIDASTNSAYGDAILLGLSEAAVLPPENEETVFAAVRHIASLGQSSNDRWLGHSLRHYVKSVPLDLLETIRDGAISSPDPVADREEDSNERRPGERLRFVGMNSARGSLAEALGDLLVFDVDGTRTEAVLPVLNQLASDPVLSVRSQAAHTVAAALRFARPVAIEAFSVLVDADDALLAAEYVRRLMLYIGNGGEVDVVLPLIGRMIHADDEAVRECGGELSLAAAVNWGERAFLDEVMAGTDLPARQGVAQAAASRLSSSGDAALAASTLIDLFDDPEPKVREAAARLAPNLRGEALAPYQSVLTSLIESASFEPAIPQLFLTLEHAPDDVGGLALRSAQRFIEVFGAAAGDVRTGAAGDAHYVSNLVIRGLAQTQDPGMRAALLDVVDDLMKVGAYGVNEAVDKAGR